MYIHTQQGYNNYSAIARQRWQFSCRTFQATTEKEERQLPISWLAAPQLHNNIFL
jgi:hypothetical protein